MNTAEKCKTCRHWRGVIPDDYPAESAKEDFISGVCDEIKWAVECNVRAGWDGGYVESIETPANFGCNQWKAKE